MLTLPPWATSHMSLCPLAAAIFKHTDSSLSPLIKYANISPVMCFQRPRLVTAAEVPPAQF